MARRLPTASEAQQGAEAASNNAKDLLTSADLLAEHDLYGPATSMAILSLEEAVKSRALMAIVAVGGTRNFGGARMALGFTEDDLRGIIYRSHRTRHIAGFMQDLQGTLFLMIIFEQMPSADVQELILEIARIAIEANESKQRGFYVDLDEATSAWKTPRELGEPGFKRFRNFAEDFLDVTLKQVAAMADDESAG
jgi:AbiV family abortive infection protein